MKLRLGFLTALAALLCTAAIVFPADAPVPLPESIFPTIPQPPTPTPAPTVDPAAVPVLTENMYYVVKNDAPFLLYASPPGLVTISKEAGPQTLRGVFIDGSGKIQKKTFTQKYLAFVEPVPGAKGRVELIYAPIGTTDEGKAIRRLVDVNTAPQPPPEPPPPGPTPPGPNPPGPPPGPITSFHVVFLYDSSASLTPAQTGVLGSTTIANYLNQKCTPDGTTAGWRRRDKDASLENETQFQKFMWDAVKSKVTTVPCVIVEVNGQYAILPFPASVPDGLATFKKYAEGK